MAGPSGKVTKKPAASKSKPKSSASTSGSASASPSYAGKAKGVTQLPVARVKRIIKEDKDITMVSNDAVFLISMATELFLESFTTKAFNLAKMEKRKTIAYKDLATAVSQHDSLEFLQDVIPKTMTLKAALEKQRVAKENEEMGGMEEDEDEEENHSGAHEDHQNGDASEGENASRPMSEDDAGSGADDMDQD
ncbi:hypothetical protein CPC16_007040 [Podila verticillata]|nr:hypothetical protein CPC16_007040 [Podila verticillata]